VQNNRNAHGRTELSEDQKIGVRGGSSNWSGAGHGGKGAAAGGLHLQTLSMTKSGRGGGHFWCSFATPCAGSKKGKAEEKEVLNRRIRKREEEVQKDDRFVHFGSVKAYTHTRKIEKKPWGKRRIGGQYATPGGAALASAGKRTKTVDRTSASHPRRKKKKRNYRA